ncbi:MAG: nucleotidyltransferase domain-containing protein [Acidobacteria bacterium]|jgi:predicted nucleotidyltransferase|nr:nucleotidyltransferase domain-containing protein [Acidobacteriota bacterium]
MMEILEPIRSVLRNHPEVKLCIVFGSVATGRASAGSDLDIAVAGDRALSEEQYLNLCDALSSATPRMVDLLDLMTANGEILKQALSKGVLVQNLDKGLYARLIIRMLYNQADMMPYHYRILRERRERFLNG